MNCIIKQEYKYRKSQCMLSEKKTEHILVASNSKSKENSKSYMHNNVMKLMEDDADLWPYRLHFKIF
mgnify:CR=1 FL=1